LYNDMEQMREAQRRRAEEAAKANGNGNGNSNGNGNGNGNSNGNGNGNADASKAPDTPTVSSRASAYMASWTSWAGEKRKNSGWGASWGKKKGADQTASMPTSPIEKDYQFVNMMGSRGNSTEAYRPMTQGSFSESILSAADSDRPGTGSSGADASAPLTQYPREFDDGFHEESVVGNGGAKLRD
jgi:hypothetical protein